MEQGSGRGLLAEARRTPAAAQVQAGGGQPSGCTACASRRRVPATPLRWRACKAGGTQGVARPGVPPSARSAREAMPCSRAHLLHHISQAAAVQRVVKPHLHRGSRAGEGAGGTSGCSPSRRPGACLAQLPQAGARVAAAAHAARNECGQAGKCRPTNKLACSFLAMLSANVTSTPLVPPRPSSIIWWFRSAPGQSGGASVGQVQPVRGQARSQGGPQRVAARIAASHAMRSRAPLAITRVAAVS